MKKMLCMILFAMLTVSAVPAFATDGSANDGTGVQRYSCCGNRCYRDDDQRDAYCDENGYCTYKRRHAE